MKNIAFFILIALFSSLYSSETEKEYVLITSLYGERNPLRRAEYMECMLKNLKNPRIKQVHVMFDTSSNESTLLDFLKGLPITIDYITGRPTFSSIFELINQQYGQSNIIIANADIYFDDSLNQLDAIELQNKFIALARWNVLPSRNKSVLIKKSYWSHDSWIFKSPIKNFDSSGIQLGTLHCDGYIAFKAFAEGYKVFNPCHSIKSHHVHLSGIRNYQITRANMNCLSVHACGLENILYADRGGIRRYK